VPDPFDGLEKMYRLAYAAARGRPKRSGWPCLARDEFVQLVQCASGHCELTGRQFNRKAIRVPWRGRQPFDSFPWAPSLDRLDNMGGYEASNVRLVCVCVNSARGYWSDEVFDEMCRAYVVRHGS
jgi:hypothetical protein